MTQGFSVPCSTYWAISPMFGASGQTRTDTMHWSSISRSTYWSYACINHVVHFNEMVLIWWIRELSKFHTETFWLLLYHFELLIHDLVQVIGVEPMTLGSSIQRSTNWAIPTNFGATNWNWTSDLRGFTPTLYLLSYRCIIGGDNRNRTNDTKIFSLLLYLLSYITNVWWIRELSKFHTGAFSTPSSTILSLLIQYLVQRVRFELTTMWSSITHSTNWVIVAFYSLLINYYSFFLLYFWWFT